MFQIVVTLFATLTIAVHSSLRVDKVNIKHYVIVASFSAIVVVVSAVVVGRVKVLG